MNENAISQQIERAVSRWENWPLLAAALFMVLAIAVWGKNALERQEAAFAVAERSTASFARLLASHVERALEIADKALEAAADVHDHVASGELTMEAAQHRLAEIHGASPVLGNLIWTDADGRAANAAVRGPASATPNVADREYFLHHLHNRPVGTFISKPVVARGPLAEWVIPVSRRLERADGRFDGIVMGVLRPAYFANLYESLELGIPASVVVLRNDGTIMMHEPDGGQFLGKSVGGSRSFQEHGALSTGTFRTQGPIDARDQIISYAMVPGRPLQLAVSMTVDDIMAPWWRDLYERTVYLVVIMSGAAAFGFISRRRIIQSQRQRRELEHAKTAAEAANRSKSGFLANMSHELRTPLNSISGFADLLDHEVYGPLNPRQREAVKDISSAGAHLLRVINSLLDLSKIEAGRMVLRLEPVDLDEIVDDAMRLCRPLAREANVRLDCEIDPVPAMLGDRQALYQIVVNLLSNAIKFTPGGGEVKITLIGTSFGAELAVRDTGIGIAAADISRVLQPYAQADSQIARKHKGTGLGLPLARQLAGLHEADFTLQSEVGRGTAVVLAFPSRRFAGGNTLAPSPPAKAG
jgi:signal transduction histidine kinase